jgi:Protein of unknown function (DUF1579)
LSDDAVQAVQTPTPDPALERLDRLVGTWALKGHLLGSDEENIVGEITFQWLEGGFFLQQDAEIEFAGLFRVKARELIGYDPETEAFASYVYSNFSSTPLPYKWDLRDDTLTISVSYPPLDATSPASSATTARASRAAGGRTPARTRRSTSPTT